MMYVSVHNIMNEIINKRIKINYIFDEVQADIGTWCGSGLYCNSQVIVVPFGDIDNATKYFKHKTLFILTILFFRF